MCFFQVEELKIELRAWQLWAQEHKKQGECHTAVSGKKADLQLRLKKLINAYGARVQAVQEKARGQGADAIIARTLGLANRINLNGVEVDEDTLQAMEGITDGNNHNDGGEQGFASGLIASMKVENTTKK